MQHNARCLITCFSFQVASCEAAVRSAVADLKRIVDSAAAAPSSALDAITYRLRAQEVSYVSLPHAQQ